MRSRILTLLVGLAVGAGCGGTPDPNPDAGPEPTLDAGTDAGVPDAGEPDAGESNLDAGPADAGFGPFAVEQWCEMFALARCARDERCLRLDSEKVDACRLREYTACTQAEFTAGVAAGRLVYASQAAADCINGFGGGSCNEDPAVCATVFQGTVEAQGACLSPLECVSGSYCYLYSNTCPFKCEPYQPVGAACNWSDRQCDPATANCKLNGAGYVCVARRSEGQFCEYWSDCFNDLACINGACVKYTAKLGEPCATTADYYPGCEVGSFCRFRYGTDKGPGVCTKQAALGGVCSGYGSCLPGLRCSSNYSTGTCIVLGSEGDICWNYNDCRAELYCANATSRCTRFPVEGGSCGSEASGYRCAAGFFCDYQDDICKSLRAKGEPCGYDGVCLSGECDFGPLQDGGTGMRCEDACVVRLDGGM